MGIQRISNDRLVWWVQRLYRHLGAVNDVTAQLSAGNDLLMPGLPSQKQAILEHMKSGKLSAAVVNTDLTRILELVLNHHQ
jgi:beta-glucosidase-like glycosyl hydrolase